MMEFNAASTCTGWSVRCAACGSCCNSAPLLSLPELFRHQHLFVGTLGMRRIRRVQTGDSLGRGRATCRAGEEDRRDYERLAADCLHPLRGLDGNGNGHDLLLTSLAFDEPGAGRCPALGDDAHCSLHGKHKPVVCSAIPFDPLMPDRLQHLVLAERFAESDDLGARCIARTTDPERTTVLGAGVDDEARRVLAAARGALATDKCYWGNALFAQLTQQGLDERGSTERIPTEVFVVLPLTPVLELLAGVSERCRERCLDYLDAQIVLCDLMANASLARKRVSVEVSVSRLHTLLRAYRVLRGLLLVRGTAYLTPPGATASAIESWLEHEPPQAPSLASAGAVA